MSKKGVNIQNIQGTYATKKKKTNNLILKWGKGLNRHFSRKTFSSVQFSSVTQSCPTLCSPKECSTPGFPVLQHVP